MEDGAIVGEYRVPSEPGIKDTEMGRGSADVCVCEKSSEWGVRKKAAQ